MSAVNLGTWRIVILLALVVSGAVILSNGFGDVQVGATPTSSEPGPTTSVTPTPTESPAPPLEGQVDGVTFAVFNGTEEIGFAGQVTIDLEDAGYSAAQDADDAPTTTRRTTVYFRGGQDADQNRANAKLLADTHLPGARVARLNPSFGDLVPADTQLVVVLGQDQVPEP
jgi:LytR cell envelope-related transcriptional attenuator